MITVNEFAELTARTPIVQRIKPAAATKGNPSRAKRSWPARLGEVDHWMIAMHYASGEKIAAIAARYQTTTSYITRIALDEFGLTPRQRGRKGRGPNTTDMQHLYRWAARKAQKMRERAAAWEALSTLD